MLDAFFGCVSGLVACTGISVAGSMVFGAVWSAIQSSADDIINGNPINGWKVLSAFVIGGIGGLISGGGADVVNNIGKYSTSKSYINAFHNSLRKNLRYHSKMKEVVKSFVISSTRYSANVAFATRFSNHLNKVLDW